MNDFDIDEGGALIGLILIVIVVFVCIGDGCTGETTKYQGIVDGLYTGYDEGTWYEVEVEVPSEGIYIGVSVNESEYNSHYQGQQVTVSKYVGGWFGFNWSTKIE